MISSKIEDSLALVLTSSKYKDDSAIITLATEKGLMSVVARGIYKKNSPLKPLLICGNMVKAEYTKTANGPNFVRSIEVQSDNSTLMKNYVSSVILLYLEELTISLFQYGDRFPFLEVYYILSSLKEGNDGLSSVLLLLGTLYRNFGIQLDLSQCIRCGSKKDIVALSFEDGGFVCRKCYKQGDFLPKDNSDLYVIKFALSPLNEALLKKRVPQESGLRIFSLLHEHLYSYFDLKPSKTFPMLLSALF